MVKQNYRGQDSETIERLQETYGTAGLNSMLRDYLRSMENERFDSLIDQVLNEDYNAKDETHG